MNSHTSLVAQQTRLRKWADLISDCQNCPQGMKIEEWCEYSFTPDYSPMKLSVGSFLLAIPNGTDPQLLAQTLRIVKELEC